VPDETTLCKFCHLFEQHGLGERLFGGVNEYLARMRLKIGAATILHDGDRGAEPPGSSNCLAYLMRP